MKLLSLIIVSCFIIRILRHIIRPFVRVNSIRKPNFGSLSLTTGAVQRSAKKFEEIGDILSFPTLVSD